MLNDAEFRGLRGAAKAMAGRYKDASGRPVRAGRSPMTPPVVALARLHRRPARPVDRRSRQQFAQAGMPALLSSSPPKWRARFAAADAQAATSLNQLYPAAEASIDTALQRPMDDPVEQLTTCALVQAQLIEAQGHKDRALHVLYQAAAALVKLDWLADPGPCCTPPKCSQTRESRSPRPRPRTVYDGLRYRWRGDATELDTIRALGQIYLGQGRYREALEALRSAGQRLPDLAAGGAAPGRPRTAPSASLFLDGQADGLQPVQALASVLRLQGADPGRRRRRPDRAQAWPAGWSTSTCCPRPRTY
jgi:tetratricopeptide (TPR) repeat protein